MEEAMNILVLDVAADSEGALSVLNQYYDKFMKDSKNNYYICVSVPKLESQKNIKVLSFPWVKKTWLHRIVFDFICTRKLIKKNNIDYIFSLQNIGVLFTNTPQAIYLHQALPYSKQRIKLSESIKIWIYQNVISKLISKSIKKAEKVIVQTQWMKDAVISKEKVNASKIEIVSPNYEVTASKKFLQSNYQNTFFYPAANYIYKNHIVVFQAVNLLLDSGINNFKVILTLDESSLPKNCRELHSKCKDNIVLLGRISNEKVLDLYTSSVLIFASFIESFGLPLLEARSTDTPIIVSDMPYSREILKGYDKAQYFEYCDSKELSLLIKSFCNM